MLVIDSRSIRKAIGALNLKAIFPVPPVSFLKRTFNLNSLLRVPSQNTTQLESIFDVLKIILLRGEEGEAQGYRGGKAGAEMAARRGRRED